MNNTSRQQRLAVSPAQQPSEPLLLSEDSESTVSSLLFQAPPPPSRQTDTRGNDVPAGQQPLRAQSQPLLSVQDEQDTIRAPNSDEVPNNSQGIVWNPRWLHIKWLMAFTALCCILAVTILVLYHVSIRMDGLGTVRSTMGVAYFWKFFPTAILVALLALWNPVDYYTRLLQPWLNLSYGPKEARKTLLLDHVSRWQPLMLTSAIYNGDWPVVLSTSVVLLSLAARIFSTGLLTVKATNLSIDNATLTRTATFDSTIWNKSSSSSLVMTTYSGIRREGLPQPDWSSPDFVAEPFALPSSDFSFTNATYEAVTNALFPGLNCEKAVLAREPSYEQNLTVSLRANATFRSDTCLADTVLYLADSTQAFQRQYKWPTYNYVGNIEKVQCTNQTRFLVTVTQANRDLEIVKYSALICQPYYEVKDLTVQIDAATRKQHYSSSPLLRPNEFQIRGLDASALLTYFITASGSLPAVERSNNMTEANFPFLTLAAIPYTQEHPGASYLEPLLDLQALNSTVSGTFSGLFSLLVSQEMLRPKESPIQGTIRYVGIRLHVNRVPAVVIAVMLLACSLMITILIFVRPVDVIPGNPNSIGRLARIIGSGRDMHLFDHANFKVLSDHLETYKFRSTFSGAGDANAQTTCFSITASRCKEKHGVSAGAKASKPAKGITRWRPLTLRSEVRALSIALCAATIGVLEVLQTLSNRSDGLVEVLDESSGRFWASVIPAVYLTGIALLFSSILFNYSLLAPYQALNAGKGATADRSVQTEYLGGMPLFTLWPAIRQRHYATAVSSVAAVLGAFLTIVVSALYSVETVNRRTAVEVERLDNFNTSWPVLSSDGSAAHVVQFITWNNLTEPQWTYDDLAFPSVSLSTSAQASNGKELSIILPARRAVLECLSTRPSDNAARKESKTYDGISYHDSTYIYTSVSNECVAESGEQLPLSLIEFRSFAPYGGQVKQLLFLGDGTSAQLMDPSTKYPIENNGPLASCPSLSFIFGSLPAAYTRIDNTSTTSPDNFTAAETQITHLACAQRIQELDVRVQLVLPSLTINLSNPPHLNESSVRYIGTVYQFPVAYQLQNALGILSHSSTFTSSASELGFFFAAVVHGKHGIPAAELTGDANIPRLASAVSKMYGRYMAQAISRKMRTPVPSLGKAKERFSASLEQPTSRLRQHAAPKLALQLLLGGMMLCGVLSWAAMPTAGILPHNPCSIAGTAWLIAATSARWATGARDREKELVFKLEERNGRFGIYVVGGESRPLVGVGSRQVVGRGA